MGLDGGSTAPPEKKKTGNSVVDSNQRSAKNRGKAYVTREDAVYHMNEMLKAAAAEADYEREFGAFVYEFEGEFYISSIIQGEIDSVTNESVTAEVTNLGLLVDRNINQAVDFSHTPYSL